MNEGKHHVEYTQSGRQISGNGWAYRRSAERRSSRPAVELRREVAEPGRAEDWRRGEISVNDLLARPWSSSRRRFCTNPLPPPVFLQLNVKLPDFGTHIQPCQQIQYLILSGDRL
jgi:hypothetical protein